MKTLKIVTMKDILIYLIEHCDTLEIVPTYSDNVGEQKYNKRQMIRSLYFIALT